MCPNIFIILGSINALNEKMGLGLTYHDVNWIYNLHHLKRQGYYLKSRYPEVRLIQYLPDSNKDFLISSKKWHDNFPYRTREGTLGGVLGLGDVFVLKFLFNSRYFLLMIFFFLMILQIRTLLCLTSIL